MSDINASIGRKQLERIGIILDRRKRNFETLKGTLAGLRTVCVLDSVRPAQQQSWYCLSAVIENINADKRNAVVARLNAMGIGTSVYYPQPVPRLTYYRQKYARDLGLYPNATRISDQSIALPVGPHLTPDDMQHIGRCFQQACNEEGV